jgi:DNA-binding beta-propeller fold protein YncE
MHLPVIIFLRNASFGLSLCAILSLARAGEIDLPGYRPDGSVLLPNHWSLRPAGRQVLLGDFPVNIAVHPSGVFAVVLHCGHGRHEITVVDLNVGKVVCRKQIHDGFYGLEFSPDGHALFVGGGTEELLHVFEFNGGELVEKPEIHLRDPKFRGIPGGIAVSSDANTLYVANVWGARISKVDVRARTNVLDMFFTRDGAAAADWTTTFEALHPLDPELVPVTPAQAQFDPSKPEAPFPYACRLDEKRQRLYVSLWAQGCVAVIDLKSNKVQARWPTGEHPNEMVLAKSGKYLFVANANQNTVTILDAIQGQAVETLTSSLSAGSLPGSTPNSLALSPDETKLFVANACNNNVAVFDVSSFGKSRSLGFIPVGWYPTSVRVTPNGRHLLVANAKGLVSQANPKGPQPNRKNVASSEKIDELFPGTLSMIDLSTGKEFKKQLADYTAQAYECALQNSSTSTGRSANNPVPDSAQGSPIKYVIYIIKENRTYDQVFGDVRKGNGDPNLCLFPERVTPNQHKLASDYVLLDNFYADAEVSPDGHEWSMGAYASDFVEKTWPLDYGHNTKSRKYTYPAEGRLPIANPSNGYLWDRAKNAGVSYRSYGEFVFFSHIAGKPNFARLSSLQGHFDPWYHPFDLDYSDLKRADRFISELKRFEAAGDMPRLQIVRLPNDHTYGTVPGKLTPTAYAGEHDLAFGQIVDAVSHSRFWPQMAMFAVEDDAQNGPDHVDAHRTVALVISPYARNRVVDSTMYSTTSMLRTIELILGLKPMTQFDSAATPMFNSFQAKPNLRRYECLSANVDINERNTRLAWGSNASQKMDFSKEDAADDVLLNEIIWRSVRGADHPMPPPVRAACIFDRTNDRDDD